MKPVRIQLSRKKGFNLQEHSKAVNGLTAVKVTRPSDFGNPFIVTEKVKAGSRTGGGNYIAVPTVEDAIACYREMLLSCEGETAEALRAALPELRGKNLACFCALDAPCHADVLLELANQEKADG